MSWPMLRSDAQPELLRSMRFKQVTDLSAFALQPQKLVRKRGKATGDTQGAYALATALAENLYYA